MEDQNPNKRTNLQNRALHKFFSIVSGQLNELGLTYKYEIQGVKVELKYTTILFKEVFWKDIQKVMFGIDSTTQLTTSRINSIIDVLTLAFGERDISIVFPSFQHLLDEQDKIMLKERQ